MTRLEKILALLVNLCLLWSNVHAQLSSEQEGDLNENELLLNEFLKGFRIEEINNRFYTCLWEQSRFRRDANYTKNAF